MATQDPTLTPAAAIAGRVLSATPSDIVRWEHTRPSAFRDPITGQYPPLVGADGAPEPDPEPDPTPDPTPDPEPEPDEKPKPGDWQAQARRHEREAKAARKKADELAAKLKEREDADKSEQEKALDQARKEAADAARSEVTGQVRGKLLKAEIKALAAGAFQDPDDAHKLLDLEDDDIFTDDGEIDTDALQSALEDLLERKPHLRAEPPNGGKPSGDADGGKGKGAKDLESMSVDEHFARIRRHK